MKNFVAEPRYGHSAENHLQYIDRRNEPAGICTHDRKRTGVKRENPNTNKNMYLRIERGKIATL